MAGDLNHQLLSTINLETGIAKGDDELHRGHQQLGGMHLDSDYSCCTSLSSFHHNDVC